MSDYLHKMNAQSREHEMYQRAEREGDLYGYENYLKNYPNGMWAKEAQQAINDIKAKRQREDAAARKKDHEAYSHARNIHTIESYASYLKNYRKGLHTKEARDTATSLIQNEPRAIEFEYQIETWVDRETGLMWEVKTKENCCYWYVWTEEYATKHSPRMFLDNVKDVFSYAKKLNRQCYAGFSDWRVPTAGELRTLLTVEKNNGLYIKLPLSKNFSSAKTHDCWTSTIDDYSSSRYHQGKITTVRLIDFSDNKNNKKYSYAEYLTIVRCVRDSQ